MRRRDTPRGLRSVELEVGGEQLVVLSYPIRATSSLRGLSGAEKEIVAGVLAGLSNASIARRRGTATRTVANQLAALYRKLGVGSRRELVALLGKGT